MAIFSTVPMNSNATGISRNITSLVFQNQLHHSCCVHNHPWRVGPTGAITTMYVGSDILKFSAPFSDRCTLTTPSQYKVLRISSVFDGGNMFGPYIPNNTANLRISSRVHVSNVTASAQYLIPRISSQ